jgi:hypothetical protein
MIDGRLAEQSGSRRLGLKASWLVRRLTGWLAYWLYGRLAESLFGWLCGWLTGWLA